MNAYWIFVTGDAEIGDRDFAFLIAYNPIVDFPPGFDRNKEVLPGYGYRIHDIAVFGYPALYKESCV